ncbi:nuclear transport factor 2 family protein [Fimbriimonas ginsengisoli]|uniref:Low molecular weight antigen MTB12-like C-terminal domain-containing protein n=1 Tax=Fimbriimonas ginsengisoli Gsoil 348 TaxID=661478 RepID=A0A068NTW4_FIMGI|nr:nuclear transport factor 2 family protein [Fimbriimonas ginsengisoli]AIE86881.1 hypothetical protein OP10G_3513 [Fimbriimonas ginsengisoli Gsoil 348]
MRFLALTLFFALAVASPAADLRAKLQPEYDKIAHGVEQHDMAAIQKSMSAFATKDFVFVDPFKLRHNLVAYSGLLVEMALPNGKGTKRFRIVSVKENGNTATVTIRSEAAGKPPTVRTSRDTWVRQGGKWKLKEIQFTASAKSLGIGG